MKIALHPSRAKISAKLAAIAREWDIPFDGELYRFINPKYSRAADIVNGAGALHAEGRWNLSGAARLSYVAFTPEIALAEALAHVRYFQLPTAKALPRVLVAVRLNAHRVLDLRDGRKRSRLRLSRDAVTKLDWRAENQHGRESITQAWGYAFAVSGFEAVIVPSAAHSGGANALVFPENLQPESRFEVVNEVEWP